ncbi:MAG: late competence development ComFB family protein [Clostridiales Family XIII bacterium]|jgi:hypothetical protein|nr:late competence development ComFB family protein [Clostridiales Family XIII bacterium]
MAYGSGEPINLILQMATDMLPAVLKKVGVEDTAENREDVLALALNALPSKYITSGGGKSYTQLIENYRHQYEADVLMSLTRAAVKVKECPRCVRRELEEGLA